MAEADPTDFDYEHVDRRTEEPLNGFEGERYARLIREDPVWALSRVRRAAELEQERDERGHALAQERVELALEAGRLAEERALREQVESDLEHERALREQVDIDLAGERAHADELAEALGLATAFGSTERLHRAEAALARHHERRGGRTA